MNIEDQTPGQKGAFTKYLNDCNRKFSIFMEELENKKNDIENAHKKVFHDDDDQISLLSQITTSCESADEKLAEISSVLVDIKQKYELITKAETGYFPTIEAAYEKSEELIRNFQDSAQLIYGDENNGLENELAQMQQKSKGLIIEVENTLAGATNIELAKAFCDQKESHAKTKSIWSCLFIVSVAGMIVVGFLAMDIQFTGKNYFYDLGRHLLPLGPLIWLGLFASRQQSQDKRLEEEYAHKEAVTRTYVGHQRQLGNLDDNNKLLAELAHATIDAIGKNPGLTLGKINPKQDLPVAAAADKIKESVTQE